MLKGRFECVDWKNKSGVNFYSNKSGINLRLNFDESENPDSNKSLGEIIRENYFHNFNAIGENSHSYINVDINNFVNFALSEDIINLTHLINHLCVADEENLYPKKRFNLVQIIFLLYNF